MAYAAKEIFYTLQGEGVHTGRAAVFCRFAGCNLWSGHEKDRATAVCQFCDTDFIGTDGDGGGKFATAEELATAVAAKWPRTDEGRRFVVCTGGEPLLQIDCTARTSSSPSRPTEPSRSPLASTGYASAPRPTRSSW
jgi:7-carboxy-7-deazaguanine synthase